MNSRQDYNPDRPERPLEMDTPYRSLEWVNQDLPYGVFDRADGSQVLFNRNYTPTLERDADGRNARLAEPAWIRWARQRWFWGSKGLGFPNEKELTPGHPVRQHGEAVVAAFVAGEPIDPYILDPAPEG